MPGVRRLGAIWDVDGTLVDTAELHYAAWVETSRTLGFEFDREHFSRTFGLQNPTILKMLFGDRYSDAEMARIADEKELAYRNATERLGVRLLPGARMMLEALRAAGFRQAIGSSAPLANVAMILRLTESAGYFDALSTSEDAPRGKPDPQVFQVAAAKLQVQPGDCVVFEDAPAGVQAAKAAGMPAIGVRFVGHHSAETLRQAGADQVVDSFEDVAVADLLKLMPR